MSEAPRNFAPGHGALARDHLSHIVDHEHQSVKRHGLREMQVRGPDKKRNGGLGSDPREFNFTVKILGLLRRVRGLGEEVRDH